MNEKKVQISGKERGQDEMNMDNRHDKIIQKSKVSGAGNKALKVGAHTLMWGHKI